MKQGNTLDFCRQVFGAMRHERKYYEPMSLRALSAAYTSIAEAADLSPRGVTSQNISLIEQRALRRIRRYKISDEELIDHLRHKRITPTEP